MSFVSELRRRNVIRMAGLYLVGAWLVTQVAATLLPVFDAPAWAMKGVVGALAVAFLPAILFAWVFELTPDGLKRDADVPRGHSIGRQTARRMEHAIVVLLALALGFFAFDKFILAPKREAARVAAAAHDATPSAGADKVRIADKSIAVLPFEDFSQAKDQGWFADGLADEILNSLARTPDLLVAARTSSFKYKGSRLAIPQIAKELGVAHVLEGSIRSSPQRIRVTAQLIRAADGFHLWSQTYDRDPADIIAIQEDLARSIATAMQTSMDPKALADMAAVGTRSVDAYQAYLRARATELSINRGANVFREAYGLYEKARTIDPEFAAAHAQAAGYWSGQLSVMNMAAGIERNTRQEKERLYQQRIRRAIETAKSPTQRTEFQALAAQQDMRWREAIALGLEIQRQRPADVDITKTLATLAIMVSDRALVKRELALLWPQASSNLDAASFYANNAYRSGDYALAADHALQLRDQWPADFGVLYHVHRSLLWDRRVVPAAAVLARMRRMATPELDDLLSVSAARQACAEGRRREVERLLARFPAFDFTRWHLLMLLGREADANAMLMALERDGQTFALTGFLNFPHFDPGPFPSLMRVLEREQVKRPPAVPLPFACPPPGNGE